jgi:hypothetical protein
MAVILDGASGVTHNLESGCELESWSWQGELDATWCDTVCLWLASGRWFSPGTPVSSKNRTDWVILDGASGVTHNLESEPMSVFYQSMLSTYKLAEKKN